MSMGLPETEPAGMLSLARLIATAGEGGWDWFDRLPAGAAKTAAEAGMEIAQRARLAQACARLGDNADFVLLLEQLVANTILQPVQFVGLGMPMEQAALNAAAREGENALVWKVLKLVRDGRSIPLKKEEGNAEPVANGAEGG